MLYSRNIDNITWDDVVVFCERGIAENAYLDYKENFPNNLEKTVSAMANTFGGLIFIGVEEDKGNKPVVPVKGIKFERGHEERIISIVLSNISPPIIPEIKVCPDNKSENVLIIIRIPQSHQTPHAINRNTKVYIRTGSRNDASELEDFATLDRIDWLKENRRKSEILKNILVEQAETRIRKIYAEEKLKQGGEVAQLEKNYRGELRLPLAVLSISMCPLYPKEAFMTPPEINRLYEKIRVPEYLGSSDSFPLPTRSQGIIVSDGSCNSLVFKNGEIGFWHTELNIFGLYFYKQSCLRRYRGNNETIWVIYAEELFCRLDEYIDSATKFYEIIGYQGMLEFKICLENINEEGYVVSLAKWPNDGFFPHDRLSSSLDKQIAFSDIVLAGALVDAKIPLIYNSAKRIAWTFGWDLNEAIIDDYYKKSKKGS